MTQTQVQVTEREHAAMHDPAAICFLCADGPEWWAEVRRKRGLERPPFEVSSLERALNLGMLSYVGPQCIECGRNVARGPRCKSCSMKIAWRSNERMKNRETYRGGRQRANRRCHCGRLPAPGANFCHWHLI